MELQVGNVFTFKAHNERMIGIITRVDPQPHNECHFYFDELSNKGWSIKYFVKESTLYNNLEVVSSQITPLCKILYL